MEDSQKLMIELVKLKKKAQETNRKKDWSAFYQHRDKCFTEFEYLVKMHTYRYKSFSNYQDLLQESREVMLRAMSTFNPKKGHWFAWAHNYISTRVSRCASLHSAIRYPLRVAKELPPHKETFMPTQIEEQYCPDQLLEHVELKDQTQKALSKLSNIQRDVLVMTYGLGIKDYYSMHQICHKLKLTKVEYHDILQQALSAIKRVIQI